MDTDQLQNAWPTRIELKKDKSELVVEFDDGSIYNLSAELLRVESPSAEVRGHGASQKQVLSGCSNVAIRSLEPVGNYAIRIIFDDEHNSGIYSWSYLYELGEKKEELWRRYLQMLDSLGLSR